MKNLAGVSEADQYIERELDTAGIRLVRGVRNAGEVPYSITGKLGNWRFNRAWSYWMALAPDRDGLPLEVATQMHEREYPITGENQPKTYGMVIRVAGHAGCPPPVEWAQHLDQKGNVVFVDPDGSQEREHREYMAKNLKVFENPGMVHLKTARFVKSLDGLKGVSSFVNSYDIDTQLGLNELARVIILSHRF